MSSANVSATPQGGVDQFEKCMKENGAPVDSVNGGPKVGSGNVTASRDPAAQLKQERALKKCRQYLPNGGRPQPMSTEQIEQARAVATCMRAAGVDYPDPDPNAGGGPGTLPVPPGVDLSDASVVAKLRVCENQVRASASPGAGGTTPGSR